MRDTVFPTLPANSFCSPELIADDHPLVRKGLKAVLADFLPGVGIVEAVDFPHVLQQVERHADFTLILLDLAMPGSERFAGVRTLVQQCPTVPGGHFIGLGGNRGRAPVAGLRSGRL
ncbi:MAG: two component LuxR family transcriptional regulator [Rhodospirillaceae bacterium]|nr:MAG: two component LuxR family transcriptional regulator [Rhodospirillaceae bacterium]